MFEKYFFLLISISFLQLQAQKKQPYKIHTVAFYNLENLFDAFDDPDKFDEASPIMELKSNRGQVFHKKIDNMARVIADIGLETTHNTPAIVGVCEVENKAVLDSLINHPLLLKKHYGIIHYDSPDSRGIDVGLLFQKQLFTPINTSKHTLKIYDDTSRKRVYTRDQLLVSGRLDGELIHLLINHWPSRRGGEARSRAKRVAAAKLNKRTIDSLQTIDPYAKIISMGDLNDDPTNVSVKKILKTKAKKTNVGLKGLYNPFEVFFKKGLGTTAYRDAWSLFDQILLSQPFLDKDYHSYRFYKAGIFNKNYLTQKRGRYKGYPFRSFASGRFSGGYSDHFPVYIFLIKAVSK